jgi:putative mRNA 3-end processing factor
VVTESTYGSRDHPPRGEIEKRFVDACNEIMQKGGNVLCPIFAVNRAQEIASVLKAYDFAYPVYMDGMARDAAQMMLDFPDYVSDYKKMYSMLKWVNWVADPVDRKKALAEPSVILSTAGLLQGGPALAYLTKMRGRDNCGVFFTGYQPPDAPGKKLLEEKRFDYHGAELDYTSTSILHFDFSAHAGAMELHGIIEKLKPGLVIVIHGEAESSNALASWVNENTKANAIVPKFGETIIVEEHLL